MITLMVKKENLTDGSRVFNVELTEGCNAVELTCENEATAVKLAESIRDNSLEFSSTEPILYNY